jgi:hypothetical protein
MFVGSLTNIRATWGRRGWSGLPCGSYVRRGTDERKGLRFVGSAWPTNVS